MFKLNSIKISVDEYCPGGTTYLRRHTITDVEPMKKQGVSGYWIESFPWYGDTRVYIAIIDACWVVETIKQFSNLKEASEFIKNKMER